MTQSRRKASSLPLPLSLATRSTIGVLMLGLVLGPLAGCGGAGTDDSGRTSEETSSRTGGIFGGSVQPRSSQGDAGAPSAPLSRPDGRDGVDAGGDVPRGPLDDQQMDVTDMGYTVGSPDAPIQVIEFSDFGCGYCRRFHLNTYPTLHEEYVDPGHVAWKYIPFVLGIFPNGEEAAIAGECVLRHGRRAFPEFRDRLFEDQPAWRDADDPTSYFVEVASEAGTDPGPLRRCIEEEGTAEQVRANNAVGRRIGLRGTPSFLVNGYPLHGAQPLQVFRTIFDDMLNPAQGGEE